MNVSDCLILSTRDFGEDSLVATLLTPAGKQDFLAKGAKKIGAKLTPSLAPGNLVNIITAPMRGTFPTIIEVEALNEFAHLKTHRIPLRFSLRALDILERITYPLIDASQILAHTTRIFSLLSTKEALSDVKKLWIFFELCVLDYLGAKPDMRTFPQHASLNQLARKLEGRIYHAIQ